MTAHRQDLARADAGLAAAASKAGQLEGEHAALQAAVVNELRVGVAVSRHGHDGTVLMLTLITPHAQHLAVSSPVIVPCRAACAGACPTNEVRKSGV